MDKVIQFQTQNSVGQHFAEALDISRHSGGGFEKIAGELHPGLKKFISSIRPDPRYQYGLMTPMGAYEYWGMNVNGDVFPEISLSYEPGCDDPIEIARKLEQRFLKPFGKSLPMLPSRPFGHKTFLDSLSAPRQQKPRDCLRRHRVRGLQRRNEACGAGEPARPGEGQARWRR
jgi:hypothetical protein